MPTSHCRKRQGQNLVSTLPNYSSWCCCQVLFCWCVTWLSLCHCKYYTQWLSVSTESNTRARARIIFLNKSKQPNQDPEIWNKRLNFLSEVGRLCLHAPKQPAKYIMIMHTTLVVHCVLENFSKQIKYIFIFGTYCKPNNITWRWRIKTQPRAIVRSLTLEIFLSASSCSDEWVSCAQSTALSPCIQFVLVSSSRQVL